MRPVSAIIDDRERRHPPPSRSRHWIAHVRDPSRPCATTSQREVVSCFRPRFPDTRQFNRAPTRSISMTKSNPKPGETISGGEALIRSMELEGVDVVFGLPGGATLPLYDPLLESSMRHILVRHEQGRRPHGPRGYAHATGPTGELPWSRVGRVPQISSLRFVMPKSTRSPWSA